MMGLSKATEADAAIAMSTTLPDGEACALLSKDTEAATSDSSAVSYSSFSSDEAEPSKQNCNRDASASRSMLYKIAFVFASLVTAIAIYHHSISNPSQLPMLQLSAIDQHQAFLEGAYSTITNEPLSYKSPADLGIPIYNDRPEFSRPGSVFGSVQNGSQIGVPLPTNEWYLNLVVGLDDTPGPNNLYENFAGAENRVYTIPYIVDTVGTIVGIRLHYPNTLSYGTVVQTAFISSHGLTLGTADEGFTRRYTVDKETLPNKLGIGIRWEKQQEGQKDYMRSSILRGMPYGTMQYATGVKPVIASGIVASPPVVDGSIQLQCGELDPQSDRILTNSSSVLVKKDVELFFFESDFTWLVFFSRPVYVRCYINQKKIMGTISLPPGAAAADDDDNPNAFQLRVDPTRESGATDTDEPLIVRVALANNCTTGTNVHFCDQRQAQDQSEFMSILRDHAHVYPSSPTVKYAFSNPEVGLTPDVPDSKSAYLFFDWAARSFKQKSEKELIMFALPHHVDILRRLDQSSNKVIGHCSHSLHGNSCLVKGGIWAMEEGKLIQDFILSFPPHVLTFS
jgi:hypothetical protein